MKKIYTTQTKILQDMSSALGRIQENDSNLENLKKQGNSMLLTILNGTNDDAETKQDMIDSSNQIYHSLNEINVINGKYYLTDSGNEIMKWIALEDINLLDYVPSIVENPQEPNIIYGNSGEKYSSIVKDFSACFAPLEKWKYPEKTIKKTEEGDKIEYDKRGMILREDLRFKHYDIDNIDNIIKNRPNQKKVDDLNVKINNIKKEKENKDAEVKQMNDSINSLENRNNYLNSRNSYLNNENKRLESINGSLSYEISILNEEIRNKQKEIEEAIFPSVIERLEMEKKQLEKRRNNKQENLNYNRALISNNTSEINANSKESNQNSTKINSLKIKILTIVATFADLYGKLIELESNKKAIKLLPIYKFGYYYDDNFLMQRTIRNVKTEKIRLLTSSYTTKGSWGRIETHNSYDYVVREVTEDERETKQEPLFPSLDNFQDILKKKSYSSKDSLIKLFEALKTINIIKDGEYPNKNYYNKFPFSINDFKDGKYTKKILTTKKEGEEIYSSLPDYFYYELNGKNALVRIANKDIKFISQGIKNDYKTQYGKSDDVVKFFVYDNENYDIYYDDLTYEITIDFVLEFGDLDQAQNPSTNISDYCYSSIVKSYKDKILNKVIEAKNIYFKAPEGNRCEDLDPSTQYSIFVDSLSTMPLTTLEQCKQFVSYCLNTLQPWMNEREKALYYTITDVDNAVRFFKLALKRLRKNSGTLLVWYQSLINFDDTYIDSLISTEIIKDSISSLLVSHGYDEYSKELFNNVLYPDYIDIEDPSTLYDGKTFNVGDIVYIGKGIKIRENKIKNVGKVEIQVAGEDGNPKTVKVTRLFLVHRLPIWCKTNNPADVMISKLL